MTNIRQTNRTMIFGVINSESKGFMTLTDETDCFEDTLVHKNDEAPSVRVHAESESPIIFDVSR